MTLVSIIIPCRNESKFIAQCLHAIDANDFPRDQVEIIVVDGMSDDDTRHIVAQFSHVVVIDNPYRTTPHALNLGIKASSGHFVVRIDAHSEIYPDYISRCVKLLQSVENVGCVGGVCDNVHSGGSSKIISMALSSAFGVGNARFRLHAKEGMADTVPFGAFPREVFENVGMFDEELLRNQDDEFNFRLRKAGYVVWLSPTIRVRYHVRHSFARLWKQFRQYGFWKVYVNRKHRTVTTLRQLVPPLFVVAMVVGALLSFFSCVALITWVALMALYLLAGLAAAFQKTSSPVEVLQLLWCFLLLHKSYGIGYIQGVWRFVILGRKPNPAHGSLTR